MDKTVQITCFTKVFYVTAFGFVGCILFSSGGMTTNTHLKVHSWWYYYLKCPKLHTNAIRVSPTLLDGYAVTSWVSQINAVEAIGNSSSGHASPGPPVCAFSFWVPTWQVNFLIKPEYPQHPLFLTIWKFNIWWKHGNLQVYRLDDLHMKKTRIFHQTLLNYPRLGFKIPFPAPRSVPCSSSGTTARAIWCVLSAWRGWMAHPAHPVRMAWAAWFRRPLFIRCGHCRIPRNFPAEGQWHNKNNNIEKQGLPNFFPHLFRFHVRNLLCST